MTVDDFVTEHLDLVATIRDWDLVESVTLCAAFLLCPKMHAYTYTLEILIHAICVHSNGSVRPAPADVAQILNNLFDFLVASDELPRDVFVVNVMTEAGNRRFLTGTWETPEFWVQHAIDSLSMAPRTERLDGLREQLHALLSFSEAAMERNSKPLMLSQAQRTAILELSARQVSQHEIARVLQLSRLSVRKVLRSNSTQVPVPETSSRSNSTRATSPPISVS
jgi:hypothetical protein